MLRISCLAWTLAVCLGCSPAVAPPAPPMVLPEVSAPLDFVVWQRPEDTTGPMPTVIAMHGLGDTPEAFVRLYQGLKAPVRVIAVRAPLPYAQGSSWFSVSGRSGSPDVLAADMTQRSAEVRDLIAALSATHPIQGKPVVTGFSQGAMMSYALAILQPGSIAGAVPVSGAIPAPLVPATRTGPAPPVRAMHGSADDVLLYEPTAKAVERLRSAGFDITLTTHDNVGHTIDLAMRNELYAHIASMLGRP